MDPISQKLQQLDEKAETLQKQGKYGESLDILEEILNLKRNAYGEDSDQYFKTSEKLCELCNLIAMICLKKEKFEASLDFLKKAETLSLNSLNYKAITYNNLACYYRRTNKLRTALQYLEKALKIEISLESPQTLADTHLNMCAVLSSLSRHQEALEHVLLSIVSLQDEFYESKNNQENEENKQDQQQQQGDEQNNNNNNSNNENNENNKTEKSLEDRVQVLAIAYHNMGVELEYLKRFEEAIQTYSKAVKFAERNLGPQHQLVENLNNVKEAAQSQIEQQKQKDNRRKNQKSMGSNVGRVQRVTGLYQDPNNHNSGNNRPKTNNQNNQFNRTGSMGGTNYNNNNGNKQSQTTYGGSLRKGDPQMRPLNNNNNQQQQDDYGNEEKIQQQYNENNEQQQYQNEEDNNGDNNNNYQNEDQQQVQQ